MTTELTGRMLMLLAVVGLIWPVPWLLSRARWTARSPRAATLAWVVYALVTAYTLLLALAFSTDSWLVVTLMLAWMLGRLAHTVFSLRRSQRRHQEALAMVAVYDPELRVHIVDDDRALAYCLPNGSQPMVVVTRGCLELADDAELAAILAHERAHAEHRHDLLVTGFLAWQRILPFAPSGRLAAQAIGAATEAWADDVAAAEVSHAVTLRAIMRLGTGVPGGMDGLGWQPDPATLARMRRLLDRIPESRPYATGH